MSFIPVILKLKFLAALTQVFSVIWSFRNHSNMLIWSKNFLIIFNVENSCAAERKSVNKGQKNNIYSKS